MSELLWIAVPGGKIVDGHTTLRVLIVPRLGDTADAPVAPEPTRQLQDFGMADWPAVLEESAITVEVAADLAAPPQVVNDVTLRPTAQANLWPRFFAPDMPVVPWRPHTYESPRRNGDDAAVAQPPPVVEVERTAARKGTIDEIYTEAARTRADPAVIHHKLATADLGTPRRQTDAPRRTAGRANQITERSPEWVQPDFHRAVTFLREHPAVLRRLGLIVELDVPAAVLREPASPETATVPEDAPRLVRVQCQPPEGELAGVAMVSPWTRYACDREWFLPAPRESSDITRGVVDLERDQWDLATFDVASAVQRVRDTARSLTSAAASAPAPGIGDPTAATLPALRSAGLMLLRKDRASLFDDRLRSASANAARGSLHGQELSADDLVLGYRVDIRPTSLGAWLPLCERRASYYIDEDQPIDVGLIEEGQVKALAATRVDEEPPADPDEDADSQPLAGDDLRPGSRADRPQGPLRADEVVVRWDGWSLAVPRPTFGPGSRVRSLRRAAMPYDLRWDHDLQTGRPQPQLRFGQEYRLRIRVADVTGGGLGPDDTPGAAHPSAEVFYARYEPVPPPEVPHPEGVLVRSDDGEDQFDPTALGPGGTIDRLVIRSDPRADRPGVEFTPPEYRVNDVRTLLPPPTPFVLAEQHGAFDDVDDVDDAQAFAWLQRATSPPTFTADGGYTWLPDRAAEGVLLRVRPDPGATTPGQEADMAWGTWPDLDAKSLRLEAREPGERTVEWDNARHAVVRLAPAEEVTLQVSSFVGSFAGHLQVQQWIRPDDTTTANDVRDGRHPMATPARLLHLVHAVRRPLEDPPAILTAKRQPGQTFTLLHDGSDDTSPRLSIGPKVAASAVQLDLSAEWREVDPWGAGEEPPTVTEQVLSVPLDVTTASVPAMRHELGDTRHRKVTYTLTAVSRFKQYFHDDPDDPDAFLAATTVPVSVPSSARPSPPQVLSTTPSFRWEESRDLTAEGHRLRRSRLGGRARVELARPWNTTGEGEELAVVVWPTGLKAGMPDAARPYVSRASRDPIWATPAPPSDLETFMFAGFTNTDIDDRLVALPEAGYDVRVARYPVAYADGRWYADVQLPGVADRSYCPFVELAVGRFQNESLDRLELSPVVRTERVQLLPDRVLTAVQATAGMQVTLEGLGPVGPPNRVVASLERCDPPPGVDPATVDVTALDDAIPGSVAWARVDSVEGTLNAPLPALAVPTNGTWRVVVREIEQIPGRNPDSDDDGLGVPELMERTVFLDTIDLPLDPS